MSGRRRFRFEDKFKDVGTTPVVLIFFPLCFLNQTKKEKEEPKEEYSLLLETSLRTSRILKKFFRPICYCCLFHSRILLREANFINSFASN